MHSKAPQHLVFTDGPGRSQLNVGNCVYTLGYVIHSRSMIHRMRRIVKVPSTVLCDVKRWMMERVKQ
jgi:hypothetical protein